MSHKVPNNQTRDLRLILGDQLNEQHSWFARVDPSITYLMMEIRSESTYVTHHIQKLVAFFLAMRAFADQLQALGHRLVYIRLDDPNNQHSFAGNIKRLCTMESFRSFSYQEPDEYRVDQALHSVGTMLRECQCVDDVFMVSTEHFFTSRDELPRQFTGKKTRIMETFYRAMRQKHGILLNPEDRTQPLGGRWNFDAENRGRYDGAVKPPEPEVTVDGETVSEITGLIQAAKIPTIGTVDPNHFIWPITREGALAALDRFVNSRLEHFGRYQDALASNHPFLFHSLLSFPLNVKLLSPREVIDCAIGAFENRCGAISLPAIEGFVRQILGWREYMRGLYWEQMPAFGHLNFFAAERPLPQFFWTGRTKMRCVRMAIEQSLDHAYAHHIQRLMVIGNFALLAGLHPDEVDRWYLGIYIDAVEWVEIMNTRGMSQFADGGIVATKPYCASANYIKKMGDYCSGCAYDATDRHGDNACPLNALYWDFHLRNRHLLERNHRIGMVYRTIDKMGETEIKKIKTKAHKLLTMIEDL